MELGLYNDYTEQLLTIKILPWSVEMLFFCPHSFQRNFSMFWRTEEGFWSLPLWKKKTESYTAYYITRGIKIQVWWVCNPNILSFKGLKKQFQQWTEFYTTFYILLQWFQPRCLIFCHTFAIGKTQCAFTHDMQFENWQLYVMDVTEHENAECNLQSNWWTFSCSKSNFRKSFKSYKYLPFY